MRDEHLNGFIKLYTSEVFGWMKLLCTNIPELCDTTEKFAKLYVLSISYIDELLSYCHFLNYL